MQLLSTFVTCVLKNVENRIKRDVDSAYGFSIHWA